MSYINFCNNSIGNASIWREKSDGLYDGVIWYNDFGNLHNEIEILKKYYTDSKKVAELLSFGTIYKIGKEFGVPQNKEYLKLLSLQNKRLPDQCLFSTRDHKFFRHTWKNISIDGNYKHEYCQYPHNKKAKIFIDYSLRKLLLHSYNEFFSNGTVPAKQHLVLIFDKNNKWNFIPIDDEVFAKLKAKSDMGALLQLV